MMKLILLLGCFFTLPLWGQETTDTLNKQRIYELFTIGRNQSISDSTQIKTEKTKDSFRGHWSGLQWGFINFAHLPEAWEALELDWSRSITFQWNFCQYDLPLFAQKHIGIVTGLGLEYQRMLFDRSSVSITKEEGEFKIIDIREEIGADIHIKRSTFKNLYLTIPVMMEIQFPKQKDQHQFHISAGVMGGFRLHSKTKIVYRDANDKKQKQKRSGSFDMTPFKLDLVARVGYRDFNIWGSYTLTHPFRSIDPHPYSIGFGLCF